MIDDTEMAPRRVGLYAGVAAACLAAAAFAESGINSSAKAIDVKSSVAASAGSCTEVTSADCVLDVSAQKRFSAKVAGLVASASERGLEGSLAADAFKSPKGAVPGGGKFGVNKTVFREPAIVGAPNERDFSFSKEVGLGGRLALEANGQGEPIADNRFGSKMSKAIGALER